MSVPGILKIAFTRLISTTPRERSKYSIDYISVNMWVQVMIFFRNYINDNNNLKWTYCPLRGLSLWQPCQYKFHCKADVPLECWKTFVHIKNAKVRIFLKEVMLLISLKPSFRRIARKCFWISWICHHIVDPMVSFSDRVRCNSQSAKVELQWK